MLYAYWNVHPRWITGPSADKPTDLILLDHVELIYDEVVKISGIFQTSYCVLKPQRTENI